MHCIQINDKHLTIWKENAEVGSGHMPRCSTILYIEKEGKKAKQQGDYVMKSKIDFLLLESNAHARKCGQSTGKL